MKGVSSFEDETLEFTEQIFLKNDSFEAVMIQINNEIKKSLNLQFVASLESLNLDKLDVKDIFE